MDDASLCLSDFRDLKELPSSFLLLLEDQASVDLSHNEANIPPTINCMFIRCFLESLMRERYKNDQSLIINNPHLHEINSNSSNSIDDHKNSITHSSIIQAADRPASPGGDLLCMLSLLEDKKEDSSRPSLQHQLLHPILLLPATDASPHLKAAAIRFGRWLIANLQITNLQRKRRQRGPLRAP